MKAAVAVGTALLVVMAGCAGADTGQTGDKTPSPPPSTPPPTTTTSTSTATTVTPPTTTGTTPAADVIAFGALPDRSQSLFLSARENGTVTATHLQGFVVEPFENHEYVRYRTQRYAVEARPDRLSISVLTEISAVDRAAIPTESEAVAYSNLSDRGKEDFRDALQGSTRLRYRSGNPLPGYYSQPGYVRYRGEYYELRWATGDVTEWTIVVRASDA